MVTKVTKSSGIPVKKAGSSSEKKSSTVLKPATAKKAKEVKALKPNAAKEATPVTPKTSESPKKRPTPAAFLKEFTPSKSLGVVVGTKAQTRAQITKAVWDYIKKHKLQDATDRRLIKANAALKAVFGKSEATMLEIAGLLNKHLGPK